MILDVDGTIMPNRRNAMPSQNVVNTMAKAGKILHVGIATARPLKHVAHILKHLNLSGYSIINGGAQIIDTKSEKILWEQPIEKQDIQKVSVILQKYVKAPFYINDGTHDFIIPKDALPQKALQMYVSNKLTNIHADRLVEKLSHISTIAAHKVPSWDIGYFDVLISHTLATKQHGIFEIAKLLGIETHDMIGVGEGYNDFPLLMACGLKVAMGNAVPELKEIADYVAPPVEKDGVVDIINKFIL
ncbi:MAG: HAD hydrolase family protein [Candidatus Levybacteria bacterium]|nr:HAD hydrolase family protein [Candidatus Levybacteria bacterium]